MALQALRTAALLLVFLAMPALHAQESDHAIHEELRALLRDATAAMNSGQFDHLLPYLTDDIEATSVTQEVMTGRTEVAKYFQEWFGPTGYMRRMEMKLEPDRLTKLSADKSWGLVRGKALEHYEAKDGDLFDFNTRWTAVMVKSDDGKWRIRAIHFGTNHLDNPVLTKVRNTLMRYGVIGAIVTLIVGLIIGGWIGRRSRPGAGFRAAGDGRSRRNAICCQRG
jgi:ketosteroid isomerase-like protein